MCVLKGFPTTLAKTSTAFPFGIWFANANTLYVADEGSGDNTFSTTSGPIRTLPLRRLQACRSGSSTAGSWTLAYTLSAA